MKSPIASLRRRIELEILSHSGITPGAIDYDNPKGDPGLFGPQSACWNVHRDFSSMIVGGFSALLLQMLHPLALAGVWDHSNFRNDMLGRLGRTAQFVGGTTFGSTADAGRLIDKVRNIHSEVKGTTPDGHFYSAMDPALLTWVHVAEARSFLAARNIYLKPALSLSEQDQYFAEYAIVAERLGAKAVPKSRADIDHYLETMRGELVFNDRTREVFNLLYKPSVGQLPSRLFGRQAMVAALDLLPPFARELYPQISPIRRVIGRTTIHAVAPIFRWAVQHGAYRRAVQRTTNPAE